MGMMIVKRTPDEKNQMFKLQKSEKENLTTAAETLFIMSMRAKTVRECVKFGNLYQALRRIVETYPMVDEKESEVEK